MTEADWQRTVTDAARNLGWRICHFRRSIGARGQHQTATAYDAAGFPDLILVTEGRIIFAELKTDRGYTQPNQRDWHEWLEAAGCDVRTWRPRDWATEVLPTLRGDA